MNELEKNINVSYSQVCVFDPDLENPYNNWTDQHSAQGFSWRTGSVSFATSFDAAEVRCVIKAASSFSVPDRAITVIRVPFRVDSTSLIECGSIMSGFEMEIDAGNYDLYYCDLGVVGGVSFTFVAGRNDARIFRLFGSEDVPSALYMEAEPG